MRIFVDGGGANATLTGVKNAAFVLKHGRAWADIIMSFLAIC